MADLTTYSFYSNSYYGDEVSQAEFPKWLMKATDELNYLTFVNINDDAIELYGDRIQKAVCALMEFMHKLNTIEDNASSGNYEGNIKAISSGNESITYGHTETIYSKAITDSNSRRKVEYDIIKPYLSDTGLLYAGI